MKMQRGYLFPNIKKVSMNVKIKIVDIFSHHPIKKIKVLFPDLRISKPFQINPLVNLAREMKDYLICLQINLTKKIIQ